MDRNDLSVEEELVEAVSNLTVTVRKLDELLRNDYPKRQEIERRFLSKQESTQRIRLVLILALIPIFVSIFASIAFTLTTVSGCFLNGRPSSACKFIPGFEEAQQRNERLIGEFQKLQQTTQTNQARIEELEANQPPH